MIDFTLFPDTLPRRTAPGETFSYAVDSSKALYPTCTSSWHNKLQITTAAECALAATTLGLTVGTMNGWSTNDFPGGCLYRTSNDFNTVDFNSNVGSTTYHQNGALVCKHGKSAIVPSALSNSLLQSASPRHPHHPCRYHH